MLLILVLFDIDCKIINQQYNSKGIVKTILYILFIYTVLSRFIKLIYISFEMHFLCTFLVVLPISFLKST